MSIPLSSALYYPSIDIKDETWLRSAVLFWDDIRTIVPVSYKNPYSSAFAMELSDEGVLIPIKVQSDMHEIKELTDEVLDFITHPASKSVLFDNKLSTPARIHAEKMPYTLHEWADIHSDKFPYLIRDELERGLNHEGWYRIDPGFAKFYMTLLASRLSERLGLSLVTESRAADQLALAIYKDRPFNETDTRPSWQRRRGYQYDAEGHRRTLPVELSQSLLIDTTIKGISLPHHLTVKEILKFKEFHNEELALFRKEVAKLTADLPKDAPIEALRQAIDDQYKASVKPAINSLKKSIKAQKWDATFNGFLKAAFFVAPPTSAAYFAGLPPSIVFSVGTGLSITATIVQCVNQINKTRSDNPYSYLLSIQKER